MQDVALTADGDGQSISRATGKHAEHRSSGGSLKNRRKKKRMTIPNNPECLSRPPGAEFGNTAKRKSGGVRGGRQQR